MSAAPLRFRPASRRAQQLEGICVLGGHHSLSSQSRVCCCRESYYVSVGLIYLLAIVLPSCLRVGRGPVLMAGILSAFCLGIRFHPTALLLRDQFAPGRPPLFGIYFVVSLVAGQLIAQIRAQAQDERRREQRATALFHLTRALAEAKTLDEAVFAALRQTDELFGAQTSLALADETRKNLTPHFASSYSLEEKERATADWVFRNQHSAGRFTSNLSDSTSYYLPLVRENEAIGVLGVKVPPDRTLALAQQNLLEAFARQLALSVERDHFARRQRTRKIARRVGETASRFVRQRLTRVAHATGCDQRIRRQPGRARIPT